MTSRDKIAELNADISALWGLQCKNLYNSKNLGALAVRECLQNSIDAVNEALKQGKITKGLIQIDQNGNDLVIEDNGIGMDVETIHNKFLTLGGTTKGNESSVGGFGLAKSVILGCGSAWEIITQDNYLRSEDIGVKPITKIAPFSGTRITLKNVQMSSTQLIGEGNEMYDYSYGSEFLYSLQSYIHSSELDALGIDVLINGQKVVQKFNKKNTKAKSLVQFDLSKSVIPADTDLKVLISKTNGTSLNYMYVRLRGLTQFTRYLGDIGYDIVVDFDTKLDPRNADYPFSTNREGLKTQYQCILEAIQTKFTKNPLGMTMDDKYKETKYTGKKIVAAAKIASKAIENDPLNTLPTQDTTHSKNDNSGDENRQDEVIIPEEIAPNAQGIGGTTPTMEERIEESEGSKIARAKNDNNSNIGYEWTLWKNQEGDYKKLSNKKCEKFVEIWSKVLEVIANNTDAMRGIYFYTGIVLDNSVNGLCVESYSGALKEVGIFLNPWSLTNYTSDHKIAIQLLTLATHEVAHLLTGNFEGHGETFSYTKETLMMDCVEYLDEVVAVVKALKAKQLIKNLHETQKSSEYKGMSIEDLEWIAQGKGVNIEELKEKYPDTKIYRMRLVMSL